MMKFVLDFLFRFFDFRTDDQQQICQPLLQNVKMTNHKNDLNLPEGRHANLGYIDNNPFFKQIRPLGRQRPPGPGKIKRG
jgi:hypothetical protein